MVALGNLRFFMSVSLGSVMTMRKAFAVVLIVTSACGGAVVVSDPVGGETPAPTQDSGPETPGVSDPEAPYRVYPPPVDPTASTMPDRGTPNAERVPDHPPSVMGEVPESVLQVILANALEVSGLVDHQLELRRSESITWPDGSLGCPEPGVFYTQALVPGYWVEFTGPNLWLDYRIDDRGYFKLCDRALTFTPPEADPGAGIAPPISSPDA